MSILSGISSIFSSPKSLFLSVIIAALVGYSAYISYTLYKVRLESSKLEIEYTELKGNYDLLKDANRILQQVNEENLEKTTTAIEAMKDQIAEERKLQNILIERYKEKIDILSNSKDVPESETTGVTDQDTSSAFINRLNSIIDSYNKK